MAWLGFDFNIDEDTRDAAYKVGGRDAVTALQEQVEMKENLAIAYVLSLIAAVLIVVVVLGFQACDTNEAAKQADAQRTLEREKMEQQLRLEYVQHCKVTPIEAESLSFKK